MAEPTDKISQQHQLEEPVEQQLAPSPPQPQQLPPQHQNQPPKVEDVAKQAEENLEIVPEKADEQNQEPANIPQAEIQEPKAEQKEIKKEGGANIEGQMEEQNKVPEKNSKQAHDNSEENSKEEERGKSVRKNSSDSIGESRQDNDTSQPLAPGTKKCFNKLCPSKKIFRKIRSKVEPQRYRFLCKSCYDNYVSNSFCQFCQQIYSNYENQEEDLNKWVGCDKCERWNHVECEKKFRDKFFEINHSIAYECLACSKKTGSRNMPAETEIKRGSTLANKLQDRGMEYEPRNYRAKIQISKEDRMPIFNKKVENFPCLESFLQSYNFRIWITDNVMREDLETLRSINRRAAPQEQPKKVKKVKQQ